MRWHYARPRTFYAEIRGIPRTRTGMGRALEGPKSFYRDLLSKITEIADISDCWRYSWMTPNHVKGRRNNPCPDRHFKTEKEEILDRFAMLRSSSQLFVFDGHFEAKGRQFELCGNNWNCGQNYVKDIPGWIFPLIAADLPSFFPTSYRDYEFIH